MASSSSDWRNVRVKEEPMSDFEDGRKSSTSAYRDRERGYRDRQDRGGEEVGGRRIKRERSSPSPPPSHSKHRPTIRPSSSTRPRSRSRSPNRDRERREGQRSGGGSRWERSRSRERGDSHRDNKERRRPSSRERDPTRNRMDEDRPIKRERRSPSPRFRSPPRRDRRNDAGPSDNRNNRGGGNSGSRSGGNGGGGGRERDWDNFFNPKSEMSQQAFAKREKEDQNRKVATKDQEFGGNEEEEPEKPKEQPNFGLSGKLTEETNTFRGVVIKYSEPPEARKPNKIRWRFYPFKGEEALEVMYVHRQSAYLLGRDRKIVDIPVDHPSCSKQHAVLQYRLVPYERADGSKGRRIKPYIIDLESANGTFVNGKQIDPKRYVELFEKDVLKFGFSSREYVLLHDESKDVVDDSPELTPD